MNILQHTLALLSILVAITLIAAPAFGHNGGDGDNQNRNRGRRGRRGDNQNVNRDQQGWNSYEDPGLVGNETILGNRPWAGDEYNPANTNNPGKAK
jgi:hypothetical protein